MTYKEKYNLIISSIKEKSREILPPGSRVVLYGSRARGDFNEESDWDIHILIPGKETLTFDETNFYAYPFQFLGWNFCEAIMPSIYSFGDWEKLNFLPYYENVERDKIILLE